MTKVCHMSLISILGKKYVKEILTTLDKYGPLRLGQLKKLSGCPEGTITRRINELEEAGLVKTYEKKRGFALPQKICKMTNLGKKALVLYEIDEELTKKYRSTSHNHLKKRVVKYP